MPVNRQITLAARPVGWPKPSDFKLVEAPLPSIKDGEVLLRNTWLSLDPYMRGRMDASKSYAASAELGQPMVGGTVAEIVDSRHPKLAKGTVVSAFGGWQDYAVSNGQGLRVLDAKLAPPQTSLGVLGMPGVTAYVGLLDIGQPKPGETVVVSAASGAVGSVVGQIAKLKGCRTVGIAGGKEKCDWVREIGFDACIDYKSGDLLANLKAACPKGIDVYFENVGGEVLEAVLRLLNFRARIPLCGLISQYNDTEDRGTRGVRHLLINRAMIQGFIVSDYLERWPHALTELTQWFVQGKLKYRETVSQGLESAPEAFIGLLKGRNFGKQLVKIA
ncbi:MAG: NADP-dependent oxidoreductase [Alphaproteobacteria bacterium]|nr:NADP-dependent oxidoreductase [Alphaproteobacteria bacterium]